MTCTGSPATRSAQPPSLRRRSARTASHMPGCSSNRPDFDLASAASGSFALAPHDAMIEQLRIDYRAMQGMIFGDPPNFEAVLDSISSLETRLNENGARESGAAR